MFPPWNFHRRSSSARHEHKLVVVVVNSFTMSIFNTFIVRSKVELEYSTVVVENVSFRALYSTHDLLSRTVTVF